MIAAQASGGALVLPPQALDRLMPLHVHVSRAGHVAGCGPTLHKVAPGGRLVGQAFFSAFEVRRPAGLKSMADLAARQGERLHLTLRDGGVEFRGHAMPDAGGGVLLNLSFGIGVADAVRAHALTDADFAPTDLTVELLYVMEAKHAVHEEFRNLNRRLEGAKSEAEALALTDTLTGLWNRRAMDMALAAMCTGGKAFALMHLDLDRFKTVNDSLGHAAGDHVLRGVAAVLRQETRANDTLARVGGDEFVILLPGLTDLGVLTQVAERIIGQLDRPFSFDGQECRIGVSVGVSTSLLYAAPDAATILNDADQALYTAKRAGRAQVVIHQPARHHGR